MTTFNSEKVLEEAVLAFAETVAVKVKQLRRFVPREKALTNPELTGTFIEEVVRTFVTDWIGHRQLLSGTFFSENEVGKKALQIDGIVYDPTKGPTVLREGAFGIVHPAFCDGVIEIKMTFKDYTTPGLSKLEDRLEVIHGRYLSHLPSSHVMGIVIADDDPASICTSPYFAQKDENSPKVPVPYHAVDTVPLRPIFVLFKHADGNYEPQLPAIENLIRAIYHLRNGTTYV